MFLIIDRSLSRRYLGTFATILLILAGLIMLIDLTEMLRRTYHKNITFVQAAEMVLLKAPNLTTELINFVIVIAAFTVASTASKRNEITAWRASGVSLERIAHSCKFLSMVIGIVIVTTIDPFSTACFRKFKDLEHQFINQQTLSAAALSSGVWLKDELPDRTKAIIYASHIDQFEQSLADPQFLLFDPEDNFIGRYKAKKAVIENHFWQMSEIEVYYLSALPIKHESYRLPTNLEFSQLADSFAPANTLSLWELTGFIPKLEQAGFATSKHSLRLSKLIVMPIYLALLSKLGFMFGCYVVRSQHGWPRLVSCLGVLFGLFILEGILESNFISGQLSKLVVIASPLVLAQLVILVVQLQFESHH